MGNNFINEQPVCRVCDNVGVKFLCYTENEHSSTKKLNHYRCNNCGSVFVGNKVESEELGHAYATLDTKDYYANIEIENIPSNIFTVSIILLGFVLKLSFNGY